MKEKRVVPYVISILCYFGCYYFLNSVHVPHVIGGIVVVALVVQILCALINVWWKISTHTAAIGGVAGALIAFSFKFVFNPVWWLCLVLILAGMVGTARMILRQHSLLQVVMGFLTGFLCAFYMILRF
jgi:membrane-associated phospholipid phosphatase